MLACEKEIVAAQFAVPKLCQNQRPACVLHNLMLLQQFVMRVFLKRLSGWRVRAKLNIFIRCSILLEI